jgi:hypothetical protein
VPEGAYAAALGGLAREHAETSIGSYPAFSEQGFKNQIVVRGRDPARVEAAKRAVLDMLAGLRGDRVPV